MPQLVVQRSNRFWTMKPSDDGQIADLGPGMSSSTVGTFALQFVASPDFVGGFTVMGRVFGQAAKDAGAEFGTIPYKRVNVGGVASDWSLVQTSAVAVPITGSGIIVVPLIGMSLGLAMTCSAGSCKVVSWDLAGSSVV